MLPLTGYTDRLSAVPGGRIEFKVSSTFEADYRMDVVRIRHGDPNPAGPGLKLMHVPMASGTYPSRHQPVHLGSYVRVDGSLPTGAAERGFTLGATIWPTLPSKSIQAVISSLDAATGEGFALEIGPDGARLRTGFGGGRVETLTVGKPMRSRCWYRIAAGYDAAAGTLSVSQSPLVPQVLSDDSGTASRAIGTEAGPAPAWAGSGPLLIAAGPGRIVTDHFNGKIERPFVAGRILDESEVAAALAGAVVDGVLGVQSHSVMVSCR